MLGGHLGRRGVGDAACMIAVEGAGTGAALGRVVGDALHHQQRAEVGVAEAERAEVVATSAATGRLGNWAM